MLDLAFDTDAGIGTQANFGLIVLQTDETIEMEMRRFLDIEGVALYQSRIPSGAEVTPETLSNMQHEIEQSVSLLPPAIDFDVIGYGCTSAASVIGEGAIEALVQRNRPSAKVTNPITATKAALKALRAKRIGFVSPYIAEVSASLRGTLEQAGYEIVAAGSFNEASDTTVARMTEASILKAIIQVAEAAPSDAIFVSCTNLRVANIIAKAEAQLGIPILSSNQAMAWHMLKLAGIEHPVQGYGQLFNR